MPRIASKQGWQWESRKRLIWLSFGSVNFRAHIGFGPIGFYWGRKEKRV